MTTLAALAFVAALLLLIVGQAGDDDGTQRGFPADRRNRGR